jgi:GTPase SAR1 family protein
MIGKEEIETFKVIIVGEYSTGKSALHKRITRDEFDPYSS